MCVKFWHHPSHNKRFISEQKPLALVDRLGVVYRRFQTGGVRKNFGTQTGSGELQISEVVL